MNNAIIMSDLHLTSAARDEYRWGLFPWLGEVTDKIPAPIHDLFILGDLTDAKDRHDSVLVNRLVGALVNLYRRCKLHQIYILHGNHDGVDPQTPYFKFLSCFPFIKYINTPTTMEISNLDVLFLPHSRNPVEDWKDLDLHAPDFILMHGTVSGALAENGQPLPSSLPKTLFHGVRGKVISGDVHVPQKIGPVEYVGSPYPVHFGDTFTPRMIMYLDKKRVGDISMPCLRRHAITVRSLKELEVGKFSVGDQIKIKLRLARAEYVDWPKRKKEVQEFCDAHELDLCGLQLEPMQRIKIRGPAVTKSIDPKTVFDQFCARQKITNLVQEVGTELLTLE